MLEDESVVQYPQPDAHALALCSAEHHDGPPQHLTATPRTPTRLRLAHTSLLRRAYVGGTGRSASGSALCCSTCVGPVLAGVGTMGGMSILILPGMSMLSLGGSSMLMRGIDPTGALLLLPCAAETSPSMDLWSASVVTGATGDAGLRFEDVGGDLEVMGELGVG